MSDVGTVTPRLSGNLRINKVSVLVARFRENVRAFFSQGQSKLSAIRSPGVCPFWMRRHLRQ